MILDSLFSRRATYQDARASLKEAAPWLMEWFRGGTTTHAGVDVTDETAFQHSGFYSGVNTHADTIAGLPKFVCRRLEKGREKVPEHPVYDLIHSEANPEMSAFSFWHAVVTNLQSNKNAYVEIEFDQRGVPIALWPLLPEHVTVERLASKRLIYHVRDRPSSEPRPVTSDKMLHVRGLSRSGLMGLNLVHLARESIGLALALEWFGGKFFGSGSRLSGVLEHPGQLGPEAQKNILDSFRAGTQGLDNSHNVQVLEEGMKWKETSVKPEESQFNESKEQSVNDMARWQGLPPHMIQDLRRATFSNIEHSGINFVRYSELPIVVNIEAECNRKLLSKSERLGQGLFIKMELEGLLRGDTAARAAFYQIMFGVGALSPNDIRELEDMNPIEGGDKRYVPLNMIPIDETRPEPAPSATPKAGAAQRSKLRDLHVRLFEDAFGRIVRREVQAVGKAATKYAKDPAGFVGWLATFYADARDAAVRDLLPVVSLLFEQIRQAVVAEVGTKLVGSMDLECLRHTSEAVQFYFMDSQHRIAQQAQVGFEAVESMLEAWSAGRAREEAALTANRCARSAAIQALMAAGFDTVEWDADPDCSMHQDGQRFSLQSACWYKDPRCRCTVIPIIGG